MSGYPGDVAFIPSLKRLVTPFRIKWEHWAGLNESEDRGDARSKTKKTP
jgi:hypothetical protein